MSDMNNQLAVLDSMANDLPDVFRGSVVDVNKFTSGIQASFPILTIKGKTWGIRYRGTTTNITAPNPMAGGAHMPVQFLDVVIIDAAESVSKVYYASGYKEGERAPPDCWSVNGLTPDPASAHPQSPTCRGCRHNVFGSKIGDAGQKGKACPDNKRLAIVPAHDLRNEAWGGPMMLRLPPASFSNYTTFCGLMGARQIPPYAVVCRLTFDQNQAFPRIVFTPVRVVTREEAATIIELQKNPQLKHMLTDPAVGVLADVDEEVGQPVPATNQGFPPPPPPQPQAPQPTAPVGYPAGNAAPVAQPVAPPVQPQGAWGAPPPPMPAQAAPVASWGAPPAAVAPTPPPVPQAPQQAPQPQQDTLEIPAGLDRRQTAALTPEQLKIQELERQLAEAQQAKARKPRSKPVAPPVEATHAGNGAAPPAEEPANQAGADLSASLASRIAGLVKN